MRRWKPAPSLNIWIALVLLLAVFVGVGVLLSQLTSTILQPPTEWVIDGRRFLELAGLLGLLVLAGALIYRVAGALTLSYAVDRNGLYIYWLGNRVVVPIGQIERIERGITQKSGLFNIWRSVAYVHGRNRLAEGGVLYRFASQPLSRSLIIHTGNNAYALSPQEIDAFVQEVEQRRRLGPIQQLTPGIESGKLFFYPFWEDSLIRLALIGAFFINLIVVAILMILYPDLPTAFPLRVAVGVSAELRPRHEILFLPLAAIGLALFNILLGLIIYRREPNGSRLLQLTSFLVQILFGVAALTIVLVA